MAEVQAREAKLIQYLNEAYGKEKELETALQAHIAMTTRDAYKKRLKEHLKETKGQSKGLQSRIKQLGGKAEAVPAPGPDVMAEAAGAAQSVLKKGVAAAKGPLHAVRGTSEPETMLKNAKTEYAQEAEEIANYKAIETLADALGDKDTVKLARQYRREEERMSKFLERTIVQLTKDVVRTEVPAAQRKSSSSRSRRRSTSSGSRSASASRPRSSSSSSSRKSSSGRKSSSTRKSGSRSSGSRSSGSRSRR